MDGPKQGKESTVAVFLRHIDGLHKRLAASRADVEALDNEVVRLQRELLRWERAFPLEDGPPEPAKRVRASAKLGGW